MISTTPCNVRPCELLIVKQCESLICFATNMMFVGINIPNYDDIREHEGFKNVSLDNVTSAPTREGIQFATEE